MADGRAARDREQRAPITTGREQRALMVVVMQERATDEQVQSVIAQLVEMGFDVHRSTGALRTVLGAVGGNRQFDHARCSRCSTACRKCCASPSRTSSPAAPSSPRTPSSPSATSASAATRSSSWPARARPRPRSRSRRRPPRSSAPAPRSCAAAPSSRAARPTASRGSARKACGCCAAAADRHNLKLVSEVMDISQLELIEKYAHILQVGARNMQNFTLLRELGRTRTPVLLKRGISATIEEWLLSAEYILAGGNMNVMLCERGIRTFESYTRNTLDISAIPVVQQAEPPADPRRSEPRHRPARQGRADGARGGGRRRRRPAHRGALRSRSRAAATARSRSSRRSSIA